MVIRVGPGEVLNLMNALDLSSASVVQSTLGPSDFGRIQVGGTAQLGGTLHIELENGFQPIVGNHFEIVRSTTDRPSHEAANYRTGRDFLNSIGLVPLLQLHQLSTEDLCST